MCIRDRLCLSGYAILAAMAYGTAHPIVASDPDPENFIPFLIFKNLAAQQVLIPLSTDIIVLSSNMSDTAAATTWGFMGSSTRLLCSFNTSFHFFIAVSYTHL